MTELHTTTLMLKRMREMKAALQECEAYFEDRADAEYFTDSAAPAGNEEMRLLGEVRAVLASGMEARRAASEAAVHDSPIGEAETHKDSHLNNKPGREG